jgi:hypothetical protein
MSQLAKQRCAAKKYLAPRPRQKSQYDRYPLPFFSADARCTWDVTPTGKHGRLRDRHCLCTSGFIISVPSDIDTATKHVKAGGGQILNGPIEVPDGSCIVQCTDPQDAMFALVRKRSYNAIGFLERVLPRPVAN